MSWCAFLFEKQAWNNKLNIKLKIYFITTKRLVIVPLGVTKL